MPPLTISQVKTCFANFQVWIVHLGVTFPGCIFLVLASIYFLNVVNFIVASIIVRIGQGRSYSSFTSMEDDDNRNE